MQLGLEGKSVIVTGGSRGIGRAIAHTFADEGAQLALCARGSEALEKTADELRGKGAKVFSQACNVADAGALEAFLDGAREALGAVHVLVNNAGYHQRGPVLTVDSGDLAAMIDVNLRGPIVLSRLAIPMIKEAGEGAIINVASLAGRTPVPGAATYSASKFGMRAFTFALAEELRDTNIKVAAVSPGPIDTGFIICLLYTSPSPRD